MSPRAAGSISVPLGASSQKLLISTFTVVKPQTSPIFFQLASLGPMTGSKYYSQTLHCSPQQWLFTKKSKAVPLQAWTGPEGSKKLRFPDLMKTAQVGGQIVSLTHWPPLHPGNTPGTHFC